MSYHREAFEAERLHGFDLIDSHSTFRVVAVFARRAACRYLRIRAEVRRNHCDTFGEAGGDVVPRDVSCGNPWSSRSGGPLPAVTT